MGLRHRRRLALWLRWNGKPRSTRVAQVPLSRTPGLLLDIHTVAAVAPRACGRGRWRPSRSGAARRWGAVHVTQLNSSSCNFIGIPAVPPPALVPEVLALPYARPGAFRKRRAGWHVACSSGPSYAQKAPACTKPRHGDAVPVADVTVPDSSNSISCPYCGGQMRWAPARWLAHGVFECNRCGVFPDFRVTPPRLPPIRRSVTLPAE